MPVRRHLFLVLTRSLGQWMSAAETKWPNVLFMVIDDQNDWIGAFGGHPLAKTFNID